MADTPNPRPSWTPIEQAEIMDWLCAEISTCSLGVKTILEYAEDFPEHIEAVPSKATVFKWIGLDDDFRDQYTRAKQLQADVINEEMLEIADDATNDYMDIKRGENEIRVVDKEAIARSRLRIDTRKWQLSKLRPEKYGDKIEVNNNHQGRIDGKWEVEFVNADPSIGALPGADTEG